MTDIKKPELIAIPISASHINALDQIEGDIIASNHTLKIALNYHTNRQEGYNNLRKKLWEELHQVYTLPEGQDYKITKVGREVCIVSVDKEDKNK